METEELDKPQICATCHEPIRNKKPPCPLSCQSPMCKAYEVKELVDVKQVPIIWILGGPGAGKGTICEMAAAKYGYTHISSGDLLHNEIIRGSDRARCLATIMKRGGLVPTDIVLDLIREEVKRTQHEAKGYLIDDYPRNNLQAIAFEQTIGIASITLLMDAPIPVMKERLRAMAHSSEMKGLEETIDGRIAHYLDTLNEVRRFPRLQIVKCDGSVKTVFAAVTKLLDPIVAAAAAAAKAANKPKKEEKLEATNK